SRRRHTRWPRDWSSDVCSSDLPPKVDDAELSDMERAYLAVSRGWDVRERGYSAIQSTKPQTVGYGLNDSPAGLAAYLGEKWHSRSEERRVGKECRCGRGAEHER